MKQISELLCGIHSNIPLCCVIWYLTGWRDTHDFVKGDWYNTKKDHNYIYCPDCVVKIMEKRGRPNKIKHCDCNGYIWNFGDPMAEMLDKGSLGVCVSRVNYNTVKIRNRSPIRDIEHIKQENRFYENGVTRL